MADERQAYTSRTWQTGDVITKQALNKIENEMEYVSAEVTNAVTGTINDQKLNDTIARKLDSIVKYFPNEPTEENLEHVRMYVQPAEDNGEITVPTIDDYQTFKTNFVQPYTNKAYAVGDYVEYGDVIYKVISAITKNGNLTDDAAWTALTAQTPSPVREIDVMKEVNNLINVYTSDSQLTQEQNKIWIKQQGESVEVPTYEEFSDLKNAINGSILSDNLAGYVNDSFTYVPNASWRSLITEINMVLIDDTITLQRGTLYGYNGNDAKISSIGFFDSTGTKLFGWYVNQAQGTVVKRSQIPNGTVYVVFNTTNVNAGFDIVCNPLLSQITDLRDNENARHCRTCTLESAYNGSFVYEPLYVRAGDIVAIKGTYNGNHPVLFFSDGKRNNQWVRAEQIATSYYSTGYVVPTSGWAGFTGWAAAETGTKSWRFDITVYTPRNVSEPIREIVVAANNSSDDEKKSADFVCDGTDDAAVINNAISVAQRIGVSDVVLGNGTFNINSYIEYNLQGSAKKVAILVHDALGKEGITLRGRKTGILPHGTILNVQESIFDNVGNDTLSIISGGAPDAGYQGSHGFNVKDIKIVLPNAQHKCVAINMQYAYWGMIENCYLQCTGYGQGVVPVDGCIGFRGWAGWSDGSNIGVKDTYAFGFRVGFQLGGEHVICERLGTRFCYYGYTFGEYPLAANSGAQVHPITLINCCDEHSAALPKFCDSGNADDRGAGRCVVDMISFIVEAYPLTSSPLIYAEESTPGGWVGRIDYTIENNEKNSSVSLPFWQNGHGLYFRTTNSAQLPAGTTAERANYAPNLAQTYYDTTLGKLLVYNGSAWVDVNGTAV